MVMLLLSLRTSQVPLSTYNLGRPSQLQEIWAYKKTSRDHELLEDIDDTKLISSPSLPSRACLLRALAFFALAQPGG